MLGDTSLVDPYDLNLARRNTVGDALTRVADRVPNATAVVDGDRRITYADFERDAEAFARGLLGLPSAPDQGEPIAIIMGNSYEFLAVYFGMSKTGRVALPINYSLSADDLEWIIKDAGARIAVVDDALLPIVDQIAEAGTVLDAVIVNRKGGDASASSVETAADLAELFATPVEDELRIIINSDDVVQCLYTSGTTARPKGALASHSAVVTGVMTNAMLVGEGWGRKPGTMLVVLPLFHVTALNTLAKPVLFMGGKLVIHPGFEASAVLDTMERERVTVFTGLPMMWAAILAEHEKRNRDLSSMETAMYAMAQMPERVLAGMDAMMPDAVKVLGSGQTEVVPATTMQRPEHRFGKNASWGIPSPTVRTKIMSPTGELLPVGETGEIVYRGPHVTAGYWNRPDANEEAFRHGWFHSGDIGHIDEEGVVWFTDRMKDIIKTGGENVSSMKIERIVANAPGVLECSVVGTEHSHWGEAVTAVVLSDRMPDPSTVSADEYAAAREEVSAAILEYARENLSGIETPKRIEFVDALPKTSTGKIRKNILRAQF